MADNQHIPDLIERWLKGTLSGEEMIALKQWRLSDPENETLFQELTENDLLLPRLKEFYRLEKEAKEKELASILLPRAKVIRFKRWFLYMAAASVAILLLSGGWWLLHKKQHKPAVVQAPTGQQGDVQPGSTKAILTLGDGKQVDLSDSENSTIEGDDKASILMQNGQLKYQSGRGGAKKMAYNTVATPIGGQYRVVLADGSKVWLNAASSLRYPTVFDGKERKVELQGEAYFEVVKDGSKPFKVVIGSVASNKGTVEVLGTHFNINSYTDEQSVNTTLLEGKVKQISSDGTQSVVLQPGQQAQLSTNKLRVKDNADLEETVGWISNNFVFNDCTIRSIMRQLARWYDVEVVFEQEVNMHFIATIPRSVGLSEVLNLLEMTEGIRFKVEGRKVFVKKSI